MKIIKRVEIVIEEDTETREMTLHRNISPNLTNYELLGIFESERVEMVCLINNAWKKPESEAESDASE